MIVDRMIHLPRSLSVLLGACLLAVPTVAQITGDLRGDVVDPSGATVQHANVELKNLETGNVRKISADEVGRFTFSLLPIGDYEFRVSANGFRTAVAAAKVRAAEASTAHFVLEVGQVNEVVTVDGAVSVLDTENAQIQTSLVGESIQDLPVAGNRDPNLLALTAPGIAPMSPVNRYQGSGNYSANGGRGRANNIMVDNIAAVDVVVTGAGGAWYGLSLPQIQEVKVITNNFKAEYGRNSSSQLIFLTKSGSNQLHGEAYDRLQNDKLNSRSWFDQTGNPFVHKQNLYGFTAGAPVIIPGLYDGHNKTFFFTSFEGGKTRGEGGLALAQVPTPAMLAQVTDPTSKALLEQYKLPAATSISNGFGTVSQTAPDNVDSNSFSIRGDHNYGTQDVVSMRYARYAQDAITPDSVFAAGPLNGYGGSNTLISHQAFLAETHTFSPAVINEFRTAFGRFDTGFIVDQTYPLGPRIEFSQGANVSSFGQSELYPQGRAQTTIQVSDTLSWVRGAHFLKFGGDIHRVRNNSYNESYQRGLFHFDNWEQFASGQPLYWGQYFGSSERGLRYWNQYYFAQDDWKVRRDLTLNLGLRMEVAGGVTEVNGLIANLNLDCREPVGDAGTGPLGCVEIGKPAFHTNYNWGPRLGFAWSPGTGKTVVRGGYGIAHDFLFLAPTDAQRFLPPFLYLEYDFGPFEGPNSFANLLAGSSEYQAYGAAQPGKAIPEGPDIGTMNPIVDYALQNPYVQQWSFGIERQVRNGFVLKATYVGTKGTHLLRTRPINLPQNLPAPATSLDDETARLKQFASAQAAAFGSTATGQSNRFDPRFDDVNLVESSSNSIFNSVQFEALRQFSDGYMFRAAYTVGKSIDDVSDVTNVVMNDHSYQQDPQNNHNNRGLSAFDLPQRLVITHIWEPQWGKSIQNPVLRKVLSGWGFSGISSFRSGFPITFEAGTRRGIGPLTLTGIKSGPVRPNAAGPFEFNPVPVGSPSAVPGTAKADGVQATSKFATSLGLSQPLIGNFGTLGRATHRINGETNFDWSVAKIVPVSETARFEFQWQMFNVFNNTSFQTLSRNITSSVFGLYSGVGQESRSMEMAARLVF